MFVHLEVWHDFDEKRLTDTASVWIQTEADGNEPWVFIIDGDGRLVARWDNVADVDELEDAPCVPVPSRAASSTVTSPSVRIGSWRTPPCTGGLGRGRCGIGLRSPIVTVRSAT